MNQIQFKTYFNERAQLSTWLFRPLYLLVIGHAIAPISYRYLYPLIWGVFFYNAFNDYLCFRYDSKNKNFNYLMANDFFLLVLSFGLGVLYFSSLLFVFNFETLLINLVVTILSVAIGLVFREKKFVTLLRLIPVPLMLGMISFATDNKAYIWPLFIGFYFVFNNKIKEALGDKFTLIHPSIIVSTFICKFILIFWLQK